jgi:alpha-L-fucosidase
MQSAPASTSSDRPWAWFHAARFGLFIHWGPYAAVGRGEQVLIRELMSQQDYTDRACAWNPTACDMRAWARMAREGGFRYAVLTTRHHDGYCLWDSALTDYTSMRQAPGRDFVREFAEAFRAEGLKVGLYYSLADWRIPAYFAGPRRDPAGWARFRDYVHGQVAELLTTYGEIAEMWFDGAWPRSADAWDSHRLIARMRELQPGIMINNRLDSRDPDQPPSPPGQIEAAGESRVLGDFGTPEHHSTPDPQRPWEACHTSTWRLWGFTAGEHWRSADQLLDLLTDAAAKGGNLLLNVGPDGDGRIPAPFATAAARLGAWLTVHGECIYGSEAGPDAGESVTWGRMIRKGNDLYLVIRFWDGRGELTLYGLGTSVVAATLLGSTATLEVVQGERHVRLRGLPTAAPTDLFPVIRLTCAAPPAACPDYGALWNGDPLRYLPWAAARGTSVWVDGRER